MVRVNTIHPIEDVQTNLISDEKQRKLMKMKKNKEKRRKTWVIAIHPIEEVQTRDGHADAEDADSCWISAYL